MTISEPEAERLASALDLPLGEVKHPEDLYLAFGCILQSPDAVRTFDRQFIGTLPRALHTLLPDADLVADLLQSLRQALYWGPQGPGKLREYKGAGPLRGWLTVVARRAALRVSRGQERFVRPDQQNASFAWDRISSNPELQLLKAQHQAAFTQAFHGALSSLAKEDMKLLRAYYLDGRTLRDLAVDWERDPSTLWRRLEAIKARLAQGVEDALRTELRIGKSEFASLLGLVKSQLDLRVSESLPRAQ